MQKAAEGDGQGAEVDGGASGGSASGGSPYGNTNLAGPGPDVDPAGDGPPDGALGAILSENADSNGGLNNAGVTAEYSLVTTGVASSGGTTLVATSSGDVIPFGGTAAASNSANGTQGGQQEASNGASDIDAAYTPQSYGAPGKYTVAQLQGTIYNETSSLSGDGTYDARVDIGYVAENRMESGMYGGLEDGNLSPGEYTAIFQNDYEPAIIAYTQSGLAAEQVLGHPDADPTGGAQYFFMGGVNLPNPFQGDQMIMQLGPFQNSVPSSEIPSRAYIGIYGPGVNR